MDLHCLQQTDSHPQPYHDQVVTEQQDANKESCAQYFNTGREGSGTSHVHTLLSTLTDSFHRVSILCHHAKWGLEMMMNFVDILVNGMMME